MDNPYCSCKLTRVRWRCSGLKDRGFPFEKLTSEQMVSRGLQLRSRVESLWCGCGLTGTHVGPDGPHALRRNALCWSM